MSRQRHVIDDTLFSYVFCIQNTIQKLIAVNKTEVNLIVLLKYRYIISTYQNLKPRVNELCDARIPDVIFNFCVSFCFLFMEEKLYLASKLIHL